MMPKKLAENGGILRKERAMKNAKKWRNAVKMSFKGWNAATETSCKEIMETWKNIYIFRILP